MSRLDGMTTTPAPAIRAVGLRKRYGSTLAVDRVDLTIAPGEVVALLGPNGAGKSTTVDMLLGLGRPDEGSVELFGLAPSQAMLAGMVGATLQVGSLVDGLTVGEMVDLMRGLSPHPLPRKEVLELAGLNEIVDRRAQKLSGGQTQRVRFALAIAGDPQLLVLDEPTGAMDVGARKIFWDAMRDWTERGRTVVFATHYLEEADAFADRVILMARGTVVADGPTTEIKAMAGGRSIRATLPAVPEASLLALPGVTAAERHGDVIQLSCSDSDVALRALLNTYADARDLEVVGHALEDAFLALTQDNTTTAAAQEVSA
jgi:ABC-2 type transport system ATP-binding protein